MLTTRHLMMFAFVGVVTLLGQTAAEAQSKTQNIVITAPVTIRVNTNTAISATVTDSWTNARIPSRMVAFSVGEQLYLTSAGSYPTNSAGVATFNWRFTKTGKHRVVAYIVDGGGYLSQRTTLIVNVQ